MYLKKSAKCVIIILSREKGADKKIAVKSYKQCIADNDYKSAIQNFKNTTDRWKKHWWECLETLYISCKEFMKNYILDVVNMLVYPKPAQSMTP